MLKNKINELIDEITVIEEVYKISMFNIKAQLQMLSSVFEKLYKENQLLKEQLSDEEEQTLKLLLEKNIERFGKKDET